MEGRGSAVVDALVGCSVLRGDASHARPRFWQGNGVAMRCPGSRSTVMWSGPYPAGRAWTGWCRVVHGVVSRLAWGSVAYDYVVWDRGRHAKRRLCTTACGAIVERSP